MKYSLLLAAIIDGTPDDHPDKSNLIKAKASMDGVARSVNEGQRRREVIKGVLAGGKSMSDPGTLTLNNVTPGLKPRRGFTVGVAASVKLGKVKGMKNLSREGAGGGEEKDAVEKLEAKLKLCETFIRKFAKEAVDWTHKMKHVMTSLHAWACAFGQVIGISTDSVSEAFDAFKMVLKSQIIPVCDDLETVVRERLLPQLSLLVDSMSDPLKLLEAMHTLEPLHSGLLNLDVSKSRPPAALLEASQSYIALRGQLHAELPQYLKLLEKGITASVVQLSAWQTAFYKDAHTHWGELWDALRVEEDSSISSAPETVRIWWERFSVMQEVLSELGILRRPKAPVSSPPAKPPPMSSSNSVKQSADIVAVALMPGSAITNAYTPQLARTSPPAQHGQYPHHAQPQSPHRPSSQPQTGIEPHSPPPPSQGRKRSGSVGVKAKALLQALEPATPPPQTQTETLSRDSQEGRRERKKQGRPSDVVVPPIGLSQSYPRHHLHSPPQSAQHHSQYRHSPRSPPLPHSSTHPVPSASLPPNKLTRRARSHSRGNIEDYLNGLIRDSSLVATQALGIASGTYDPNPPGLTRRSSLKRDTGTSSGPTDSYANRGSYTSQSSGVIGNAEDTPYVSELLVLDKGSWGEGEVKEERPKPQRRGSVKKKFADTLENVARRSPSLHSLKRFSGPPRLGSPSPSPGQPQSSGQQQQQQQQGHTRARSRSRSRPPTPRTPSYPSYPTPPPLIITDSSNSSHSQGPYSTPVLYACKAVSPFHLDRDALYEGIGFHRLEVGMRLGIVQEYGHPCTHPSLPVHIDDGEDCLLLAMDVYQKVGWAFASFLVPVD